MAGGTKPQRGSKRTAVSQDGRHKGGGIHARKHAGPGRRSRVLPQGAKGWQAHRRTRP